MAIGHHLYGAGSEHVVLCHGWFGGAIPTFDTLLPYLDTDKYTYAVPDFRGYGSSKDLDGDFTMDEAARDVMALAAELGWDGYHVVGHSMGGKIAQCVAALDRGRVKSVVAVTPVPATSLEFDDDTWALFHGAIEDQAKRAGIVDFSTGGRLTPVWSAGLIRTLEETSSRTAYAGYLHSWVHGDFTELVSGVGVPLKVMVGALDPTITPSFAEDAFGALYQQAQFETLENCGHYPAQELPVYLATAVEAFLARHHE